MERISAIQINGNELFTDLSGHFTKDILLSEGYNVIEGDVVNIQNYVRHDAKKLSKVIIDLTLKTKGKKISID